MIAFATAVVGMILLPDGSHDQLTERCRRSRRAVHSAGPPSRSLSQPRAYRAATRIERADARPADRSRRGQAARTRGGVIAVRNLISEAFGARPDRPPLLLLPTADGAVRRTTSGSVYARRMMAYEKRIAWSASARNVIARSNPGRRRRRHRKFAATRALSAQARMRRRSQRIQ